MMTLGRLKPTTMMTTMSAIAHPMFNAAGTLRPRVAKPQTTAATMNSVEIRATVEFASFTSADWEADTAKVLATMEVNAATLNTIVR